MNPFELLFVPGGRVSRLPYFLAQIGVWFAVMIVALVLLLVAFASGFFGPVVILCILLGLVAFAGGFYANVNLVVKRLHDMDYSGWHAAWIYGISVVGGLTSPDLNMPSSTVIIYVLATLASFGVGLWLLFMPGVQGQNDYGEIFG